MSRLVVTGLAARAPPRRSRAGRRDPARAVVGPRDVDDVRAVDAQRARDLRRRLVVDRARRGAAAARRRQARRRRGGSVTSPAPHSCTIASAPRGAPPCSSQAWQVPSVGCPANGSSSHRREDAHAVVRPGDRAAARRSSRRGSSSARSAASPPSRALGVEHDRDRVAAVRPAGEDVDLAEGAGAGHRPRVRPCPFRLSRRPSRCAPSARCEAARLRAIIDCMLMTGSA